MSQSDSASRLDLHLLGPPQVIRDGKHVTGFRSSKAQALLYFLAVTGSTQRRSTLAALLWPEADEKQASASLRNVLSNLRALVGDHLTVTRETAVLHGEGALAGRGAVRCAAQADRGYRDGHRADWRLPFRYTGEISWKASMSRMPRSSSSGRPSNENGCARPCSMAF